MHLELVFPCEVSIGVLVYIVGLSQSDLILLASRRNILPQLEDRPRNPAPLSNVLPAVVANFKTRGIVNRRSVYTEPGKYSGT